MKLSIVASLYQSAPYLREFYERAGASARQLVDDDYEIVLVNDGSPDNSLDIAISLSESDKHIVVVELSRNFGHHKAMMTGLGIAEGDLVYLLDSDLEEEPEWLLDFSEVMEARKCDVVFGIQSKRKGHWFEVVSGRFFYKAMNFLTGVDLPENPVVARLMTRQYVEALNEFRETDVYIGGLMILAGFTQVQHYVTKGHKKETTYTPTKKIVTAFNAIASLSSKPLLYIFYLGLLISLVAFVASVRLIVIHFFYYESIPGWLSIVTSVWLMGGLIMVCIGIIGLYISKLFNEVKGRPYTIIKNVHRQNSSLEER